LKAQAKSPPAAASWSQTACLQLIENLQRADMHGLDESRGYATLIQLHTGKAETINHAMHILR
jgi:hypothetical protein